MNTRLVLMAVLACLATLWACQNTSKTNDAGGDAPAVEAPAEDVNVAAVIAGKWQSMDDPKSIMFIEEGDITQIYGGETLTTRDFTYYPECPADACAGSNGPRGCFTSAGEFDIECYNILSIAANSMELSYVGGTGQTLRFQRVQ